MTLEAMVSEEKVHLLPLEKIDVDKSWNSRKYLGDDLEGGLEEHSFVELMESIRDDGLDNPVEVIPSPTSDGHYFLISGFRRITAVKRLNAEATPIKGMKAGYIKAYIRPQLTQLEALVRNGRENTGRASLNMADTAYLVHRLSNLGLTEVEIARRLALSQPYVNSLHTVYKGTIGLRVRSNGLDTTIFDHWRDAPGRISFNTLLEFARTKGDPSHKEKKYLELLAAPKGKAKLYTSVTQPQSPTRKAETFGLMLGRLAGRGLIALETDNWRVLLESSKRVDFKGNTPESIERVTQAAKAAFERGKSS